MVARRISEEVGLSRDYIARLCKKGAVVSKRIGTTWYADPASVRAYLAAQEHAREYRRETLRRDRSEEYQSARVVRGDASPTTARAAASLGNSPTAPIATPIQNVSPVHDRLRRAIEKKSAAGEAVLLGATRVPGMLHAVASIPSQAITHMPTHTITPTMDLLHRLTAFVGAFALMFGVYSAFDTTFVQLASDSTKRVLEHSRIGAVYVASALHGGASLSAASMEAALSDPRGMSEYVRRTAKSTYLSMASIPRASGEQGTSAVEPPRALAIDSSVSEVASASVRNLAQAAAISPTRGAGDVRPAGAPPAQSGSPIATFVVFSGSTVAYGDVIAFDPVTASYTLTNGSADAQAFGIAIEQPVLLFKSEGAAGDLAVVSSGAALVNVTLEGGVISPGDRLTPSSIPGKARRASEGEFIIGTANEAFTGVAGVVLKTPEGRDVPSGTIAAVVSIAPGAVQSAEAPDACASLSCRLASAMSPEVVRTLVRYALSGAIAALSITLAFKSFMSDANYGVISMGRNPRARASIQSMVAFNAILALAIASAGLFAAMVVLFAG